MIYTDVLIVGGGMVGLSTAYQLLEHNITSNIIVIDKEAKLGLHSSGRNSGVLHSGLYYKPDSLKASVCVDGQQRLRKWIEEQELPLNPCGKVIVPQRYELDSKLDLLAKRGTSNGAKVEILDSETGISPGQACVFYSKDDFGDKVLGGGWIHKTYNQNLST